MDIVETKVNIDKELLEKSKEYNVDIDAFLDTEFRKYVGAIEDKKKLKEHKHGLKATLQNIFNNVTNIELQETRRESIKDIVKKLCNESKKDYAITERIIREAELQGLEPDITILILERLKRHGEIYEPVKNGYRLTGS